MSDPESKPLSPTVAAGIVFVAQIIGMAVLGAAGGLATLPQGVQFLFGLEVVGFPLIVYLLMKKRQGNR
jgi:hypothetical protein